MKLLGVLLLLLGQYMQNGDTMMNNIPSSQIQSGDVPHLVEETIDGLCILWPQNECGMRMELVCGNEQPSSRDTDILFCAAAAFTESYSIPFSHDKKVQGPHIADHRFYYGGAMDYSSASFVWYNGKAEIVPSKSEEEWLKMAEQGAVAFTQHHTVVSRQLNEQQLFTNQVHIYRVLAMTEEGWCIITSAEPQSWPSFCDALLRYRSPGGYPVDDAVYMDMGALQYSYWRDVQGEVHVLADKPKNRPIGCNWLVIKR